MAPVAPARPPRIPRAAILLGVTAAALVTCLALRELSWLLGPGFLAMLVVVLVHPVHAWLLRRGVPGPLAMAGLLVSVFGVLIGLVAVIVYSLGRLATLLPTYVVTADGLLSEISAALQSMGLGQAQARELLGSLDLLQLARLITNQLPSIVGLGAALVMLYSLLIFLAVESTQIGLRSASLAEQHPRLSESLRGWVAKTRRYVAVTGGFAVVVGALDTVFLLLIGIPLAPLWGVLAAVCNFIPYLGFAVGMVPPALLALLIGGWHQMVLVIAVYVVLNSIITTLLPAKFVGDAVGLSMVVTFLSLAFWAWLLGPLGAVLAIPLSLLVKALLVDPDPRARWLGDLIASGRELRQRKLLGPV